MNFYFKALSVAFVILSTNPAIACPCGCGSVNTMTLFPGERGKVALYAANNFSKVYVDHKGEEVSSLQGSEVEMGVLGSFSITEDANVGAGLSRVTGQNTEPVLKEPLFFASFVVNRFMFTKPYYPLSILTISYSPEDDSSFEHNRGYALLGVDLSGWFTFEQDNFGGSFSVERRFASENKITSGKLVDRGYLFSMSTGYTRIMPPIGQYGINYSASFSTDILMDGVLVEHSNAQNDRISLFGGLRVADKTNAKLELFSDAWLMAKNSAATTGLSLTISRTF